jgi:hypothetical protein
MMCVRHGFCMPRIFHEFVILMRVMVSVAFSRYRSILCTLMRALHCCHIVAEYAHVKKLSAFLCNEINVIRSPADS